MFQQSPYGSPLDPMRSRAPLGAMGGPELPTPPAALMTAPAVPPRPTVSPSLVGLKAPPSVKRKRLNMWDREHISQTLAQISKGFMSGGNVLQGLAAAGTNVADLAGQYQKASQGSTEVGGPDNAFEITTNPDGSRVFKRIEEVAGYLDDKKKRDNAPKPKETAEYIGDMSYAIEQLDEAQRPGAYQLMLAQAKEAGHNVDGAPPEYSPTFARAMIQRTIGARQGSANEALRLNREAIDADRDATRALRERNTSDIIARRGEASGRAAEKHTKSMRSAPPSKRRGTSDLDYLR